jgi:hypothetical protein
MTRSRGNWRILTRLTIGGGLAFWSATFAISLTPIAAEYRAALSIAYVPMLFEALVGGLIIGLVTGYSLIRLHHVFPDKSPAAVGYAAATRLRGARDDHQHRPRGAERSRQRTLGG